jgi:hypothetical protein
MLYCFRNHFFFPPAFFALTFITFLNYLILPNKLKGLLIINWNVPTGKSSGNYIF